MKRLRLLLAATVLFPLAVRADDTPKGFDTAGVDFYLSQQETAAHVSLDDLATYTKAVQDACAAYFANSTTPEDIDIVVAVKPGPESRVWLISMAQPPADQRFADLRVKLAKIDPPPVHDGPVAFDVHGVVAGGNNQPPTTKQGQPEMPQIWRAAILRAQQAYKPINFNQMLDQAWNDSLPVTKPNLVLPITLGILLAGGAGYMFFTRRKAPKNNDKIGFKLTD